jgi:uncharacterized protein (DUF488 family)
MSEQGKKKKTVVYSIGHSDHPFDVFLNMLRQAGVQILVDLRSIPQSKHVPQFNQKELMERLPATGITYHHLRELGGKGRKNLQRSPNSGLAKPWQAYADYMLTDEFERGLMQLMALISIGTVAVFCAEADWKKCHRRFLADMLTVRGIKVVHLSGEGHGMDHVLPAGIEIKKDKLVYPAPGEQLSLF